jgi:transmembrane sensor
VIDDPAQNMVAPGSASDIDAQAMDFILRRNLDNWEAADQSALDAWLSQSLAHKAAYWRLNSMWNRADRLGALRSLPSLSGAPKPAGREGRFLKIAAALVLFASAAVAASNWFSSARTQTYATQIGGHKNIELADGTRIELNTNTVLNVRVDSRARSVNLVRGEALFHVKHDAAHPFVVVAGSHRITDLGTSFVVREKKDRLEVALIEGRAQLESTDTSTPVKRVAVLMPGDEAVATSHQMSVTRKISSDIQDELGWRRGMLVFHRATLAEVANEYNRYNHKKIVIADDVAGARTMSATLPTNDLATFARIARNFLGLHVRESGEQILISQ